MRDSCQIVMTDDYCMRCGSKKVGGKCINEAKCQPAPTHCNNCGKRTELGECTYKNCHLGGQKIPATVNHLDMSILNYFGFSAGWQAKDEERYEAIDNAYFAKFVTMRTDPNFGYLQGLGSAQSKQRATALVTILNGLNSMRNDSDQIQERRIDSIRYLVRKYNASELY
jgi:hypothetical protein